MNNIKTIDLWTEQYNNHYECFNGAFIDGFDDGNIPIEHNCAFINEVKTRIIPIQSNSSLTR